MKTQQKTEVFSGRIFCRAKLKNWMREVAENVAFRFAKCADLPAISATVISSGAALCPRVAMF